MTQADRDRLIAVLVEVQTLARSAQLCTQHTTVPDDGSVYAKKYRRTPADVRTWLTRLNDAHIRLTLTEDTIPSLRPQEVV